MKAIFHAPEIVILVFQSCDTLQDALTLASTSKFLASIWRAHTAVILYHFLKADIAGFDQALLAVQATNLMLKALQDNVLPPRIFPLHELRFHVRKPDLGELRQVRDMQHLARCVEHIVLGEIHAVDEPLIRPSDEERIRMTGRFHRAVYRVLFAGAALTRAYLEPLFLAAAQGPPGFLQRFTSQDWDWHNPQYRNGFTEEDFEYLDRFPVYDLEGGQEKWEPAFGDLASWLLADMERDAEDVGRLRQFSFFLAAYEHMTNKFQYNYPWTPYDQPYTSVLPRFPGGGRQVSVMTMFGTFAPETVFMPARVEDSSRYFALNKPLFPRVQEASPSQDSQVTDRVPWWTIKMPEMLETMHKRSGRPNKRNGWLSPCPRYRFAEFVLSKFFKARFEFEEGLVQDFSVRRAQDYDDQDLECPDLCLASPDLFRDRWILFPPWELLDADFDADKPPPTLDCCFI